jgi:alkylhydroperoxidase family enzyme
MVRVPPLAPAEWPAEMRAALAALEPPERRHPLPARDPDRPKGLNALGLLAHHPALTRAFNTFNGHVLFATTLSARQRELIVLRVARRRQSEYEWAQHTILAADAGLTPSDIDAIAADGTGLATVDRALVDAVDQLIDDAMVHDDTWALLAREFDVQQLMDVVFTVGAYDALAMAFRSFGVELDADLRRK